MRSFLFVPGDSEKKLAKAYNSGADVVILDLEDSVSAERKAAARALVAEAATDAPGYVAVRINALDAGLVDDDLEAVMAARPEMIVLPKSETGADVAHLAARLSVHEAQEGVAEGQTQILAIATETARAMFGLGTYDTAGPRLAAMTWGLEDLSAALGVSRTRDDNGRVTDPFAYARIMCLAGAKAAGVLPINFVYTDFRDSEGLAREFARGGGGRFPRQAGDPPGAGGGDQRGVHALGRGGGGGQADRRSVQGRTQCRGGVAERQDGRPPAPHQRPAAAGPRRRRLTLAPAGTTRGGPAGVTLQRQCGRRPSPVCR